MKKKPVLIRKIMLSLLKDLSPKGKEIVLNCGFGKKAANAG